MEDIIDEETKTNIHHFIEQLLLITHYPVGWLLILSFAPR
jgi:hypothetical protein